MPDGRFLAEHLGRAPLAMLGRGDARGLDALLSPDDLEGSRLDGLPGAGVRVLRDGEELPVTDPEGRVLGERVTSAVAGGASIAAQGLHERHAELAALCAGLTAVLGQVAQANAYLTPPGGRALAAHADIHDVFMIQTHGRKRWDIFEPVVELPGARQEPDLTSDPGVLHRSLELKPGDVLYLPRGWGHRAAATTELSLHVTVGVLPYTWGDAVRDACARDEDEDPALRRTAGGEDRAEALASVAARLDDAGLDCLRLRHIALSQPRRGAPDGPAVDGHTRVRLRADVVVGVLPENGHVSLLHGGRRTRMPAALGADLVGLLARAEPWRARDIPGDRSDAARVGAVAALVAAGIVEAV